VKSTHGVALVLLALLAVSCSSGQDSGARIAAIRSAVESPTREEVIDSTKTFEEAVARCMIAAGFDYVPEYMDEEEADALLAAEAAYPAIEEHDGVPTYGVWERLADDETTDGVVASLNDRRAAALPPAEQDAYYLTLFGDAGPPREGPDPDDGCRGVGHDAVGNPAEQYADEIDHALTEIEDRLAASPKLTAALDVWRTCMAAQGYDGFSSPADAVLFIEDIFFGDKLVAESGRAKEITIATLDKSCDEDSGLRSTHAEERSRIADVVLSEV
jgi:hypothetical protein